MKKVLTKWWAIALVLAIFCGTTGVFSIAFKSRVTKSIQASTLSETSFESTSAYANKAEVDKAQTGILAQHHIKAEMVTDGSRDSAPAGENPYTDKGLFTGKQVTTFLTKTPVMLTSIMDETWDSTTLYVLDSGYWRVWRLEEDVWLLGNSGLDPVTGKTIKSTVKRLCKKGDYLLLYVSPETGRYVAVRAACGNFQFLFPVPVDEYKEETTTKAATTTTTATTVVVTSEGKTTTTITKVVTTTAPYTTLPATTKPSTTLEKKDPKVDPNQQSKAGDGGGTNRNTGTQPSTTPLTTKTSYTWVQNTAGTTWLVTTTVKVTTTAGVTTTTTTVTTTKAGTTGATEKPTTTEKLTTTEKPTTTKAATTIASETGTNAGTVVYGNYGG